MVPKHSSLLTDVGPPTFFKPQIGPAAAGAAWQACTVTLAAPSGWQACIGGTDPDSDSEARRRTLSLGPRSEIEPKAAASLRDSDSAPGEQFPGRPGLEVRIISEG